jgi:hypothetical protein
MKKLLAILISTAFILSCSDKDEINLTREIELGGKVYEITGAELYDESTASPPGSYYNLLFHIYGSGPNDELFHMYVSAYSFTEDKLEFAPGVFDLFIEYELDFDFVEEKIATLAVRSNEDPDVVKYLRGLTGGTVTIKKHNDKIYSLGFDAEIEGDTQINFDLNLSFD